MTPGIQRPRDNIPCACTAGWACSWKYSLYTYRISVAGSSVTHSAAVSFKREHAELLQEYLRVLGEVSASLRDDSQAVLAQATQAVAQARSRQLERADAPASRVRAGRRSSYA